MIERLYVPAAFSDILVVCDKEQNLHQRLVFPIATVHKRLPWYINMASDLVCHMNQRQLSWLLQTYLSGPLLRFNRRSNPTFSCSSKTPELPSNSSHSLPPRYSRANPLLDGLML